MSGTIKMVGSADQHWDEPYENEDHTVDTRLIGKEDIYWDSDGDGSQESFVDRTGTDRALTLINASHIPLPVNAREACGGAKTVSEGLIKLSQTGGGGGGGGGGGMSEDTTVTLTASLTHAEKQSLINSQAKNLGGHTLTIAFPEAIDLYFTDHLYFSGYYNGTLVIDLNGITITDSINVTKLFHIYDCNCKVEVKDGTLKHTLSLYGILSERSQSVYLSGMTFIGSGGTTNYALCCINSDGYTSGCTYSNDNVLSYSGLSKDYTDTKSASESASAVNTHNSSASAHSSLFASKANVTHTHTAAQANADPAGTASTAVSNHNSSNTAHNGVLAKLASPAFTGSPTAPTQSQGDNSTKIATTAFVARAVQQSGIIDRDVTAHNKSASAHSGILAPLSSPALTGSPTAPTQDVTDNSTKIATTAYVKSAISNDSRIPTVAEQKVTAHNSSDTAHAVLFAGKANTVHTHTAAQVGADSSGTASGLVGNHNRSTTAHSGILAPLSSPTFTGEPKAPTQAEGDNSTNLATTAFVARAVEHSGAADRDIAAHNRSATAHSGILAPLSSPALTGNPTATTQELTDDSTRIATTAFVKGAILNDIRIPTVAEQKVYEHNISNESHAVLFSGKANAIHTHTASEIGAEEEGVAETKVSDHNGSNTAHSSLFATKAALNHTHTAAQVGADATGTAIYEVTTHNESVVAHSTLFAGKAALNHTHTAAEANADPAGTAATAVTTHNTAADVHLNLLPAGTILPFAGSGTVPDLFLPCDGRAISRTDYGRLFAVIGITYGGGDGINTFNVPDFRGAFLRGYKSGVTEAIGTKQIEGLPGISGNINFHDTTNTTGFVNMELTGAFKSWSSGCNRKFSTTTTGSSETSKGLGFDATRCSSIYGSSDHVTPENYAVQYIIRY